MAVVKTVHHGGITHNEKLVSTFAESTRPALIKELNNWFFDYFYSRKDDVKQLPPLDDWTHSDEDDTMWYISFPDKSWKVWIRHEPLEFR